MTTTTPLDQRARARLQLTVVLVWVLVALGAVAVGILAPAAESVSWLPIVLGGGILVTFVVQLAIVRKEGLVMRIVLSLSGSVLILAVATGVLAIVRLASA